MNLNNETENLVKNTSKITGFINSNKKPQKLKKNEILKFKKFGKNIIRHTETTYSIGDQIKIIEGPFNEFNGSVSEVKPEKKKVRVLVSIFGRFTPVELDFNQLEPLS
jgi:transcriptional antiterminator NusG